MYTLKRGESYGFSSFIVVCWDFDWRGAFMHYLCENSTKGKDREDRKNKKTEKRWNVEIHNCIWNRRFFWRVASHNWKTVA